MKLAELRSIVESLNDQPDDRVVDFILIDGCGGGVNAAGIKLAGAGLTTDLGILVFFPEGYILSTQSALQAGAVAGAPQRPTPQPR